MSLTQRNLAGMLLLVLSLMHASCTLINSASDFHDGHVQANIVTDIPAELLKTESAEFHDGNPQTNTASGFLSGHAHLLSSAFLDGNSQTNPASAFSARNAQMDSAAFYDGTTQTNAASIFLEGGTDTKSVSFNPEGHVETIIEEIPERHTMQSSPASKSHSSATAFLGGNTHTQHASVSPVGDAPTKSADFTKQHSETNTVAIPDGILQTTPTPSTCRMKQTSTGLHADCTHLGLSAVPTDLPTETTFLDLDHNNLTILHNNSFSRMPKLTVLNVNYNHLVEIEGGTFEPLTDVEVISLQFNAKVKLNNPVFRSSKLQYLDLSQNFLGEIPMLTLQSAENVTVLLSGNNITSLDFTHFNVTNLLYLKLDHNEIAQIADTDFYPLQNVTIGTFSLGDYITKLPERVFHHLNVHKLVLSHNKIQNFSLYPFLGMISLQELEMIFCHISTIIPLNLTIDSPRRNDLPPLKTLYLDGNNIHNIPSAAFNGLDQLERLHIHQSNVKNLTNDCFQGLTSLQYLTLTNNKITDISKVNFTWIPKLQTLDLAGNLMKSFQASHINGTNNLITLDISRCGIRNLVTEWALPSLEALDLSQNKLEILYRDSFNGLNNLINLTLAHNTISIIKNNAFRGVERLQRLDLSHTGNIGSFSTPFANLNELIEIAITDAIFYPDFQTFLGLNSLKKLDLRRASLHAENLWDFKNNNSVFITTQGVETMFLTGNSLDIMHPGTFAPLKQLTTLHMDNCEIFTLHPDLLTPLSSLVYLIISNNNILTLTPNHMWNLNSLVGVRMNNNNMKQIDKNLFSANEHFSFLYLSGNAITWIAEGTVLPKHYLDISNNPITCVCQLQWFRTWLDTSNVTFGKASQTICSQASLPSLVGKPLLSFKPKYECGPNAPLILSITILILAVLIMVITAYQKRWWLSYKCFHLKLAIIGYQELEDGRDHTDYAYDLNIVFDDHDEDWVRDTLRPGMEEQLPHLTRIVCGDDNLPLGMYYMDAIIYVMENSFKTVLVISEHSVNNHNFIKKLREAVEQMNDEEVEKALLVFVDDIPDGQLPYLVRLFLSQNKPYLLWNEDKYGQKLFWAKLVKNMEVNKKMNDLLPI